MLESIPKSFKLEQLLTITTGLRLVVDMDEMYALISYMLGTDIYTHEAPAARAFIKPHILTQYPNLENIQIPKITENNYSEVISALHKQYGNEFPLNPVLYVDTIKFRNDSFAEVKNKINNKLS